MHILIAFAALQLARPTGSEFKEHAFQRGAAKCSNRC